MSSIKILIAAMFCFFIVSCSNEKNDGKFIVTGNLKNAKDQHIYLEQLFFSDKAPEVLDTAELKNGIFSLHGKSSEEGLFRLRLENDKNIYLIINDQPDINVEANINDNTINSQNVKTPINTALKNMIVGMMTRGEAMDRCGIVLDSLKAIQSDSLYAIERNKLDLLNQDFEKYLNKYIDSSKDPILTIFGIGNDRNNDPEVIKKRVADLTKRFPKHKGVGELISQYNKFLAELNKPKPENPAKPAVGSIAPDFTMNGVDDKPFSLSQLKGQYVLVDFWASWCGPCRGENPNVVAAFNKYKNKNFTVLGVSLDDDKGKWLAAIKEDNLSWKHISDLKGWTNAAVSLYGFDGIPYNVLIDPQGKILATELRGSALDEFLGKELK